MSVQLQDVTDPTESEALVIVESVKYHGKVLAVAQASGGSLVLVRERERGKVGADGKRSRDNGTERFWKRTADLADFRDALAAKLIA